MPNWCSTNIVIQCGTKDEAHSLYTKIESWISKNAIETDFGNSWLGNVVENSGIGKYEDFSCRGAIEYLDVNYDCVIIDTETAWSPMLGMWLKIIDKYAPGATLIYRSQEPGMMSFLTNDPAYQKAYYIDVWDSDIFDETGYYDCFDEDEVVDIPSDAFNVNLMDAEQLIQMANERDGILVAKYEFAKASDFM